MLRITTTYHLDASTERACVLKVKGTLRGESSLALYDSWRRILNLDEARICVDLADVDFIDTTGKLLLANMRRSGVEILEHVPAVGSRVSHPSAPDAFVGPRDFVTRHDLSREPPKTPARFFAPISSKDHPLNRSLLRFFRRFFETFSNRPRSGALPGRIR